MTVRALFTPLEMAGREPDFAAFQWVTFCAPPWISTLRKPPKQSLDGAPGTRFGFGLAVPKRPDAMARDDSRGTLNVIEEYD